jgi:predicted ester cyclase
MHDDSTYLEGTTGPFRDLVDYILGITHEIWESRQVERIRDYYARDCVVYMPGAVQRGVDIVVRNTYDSLVSYPDRLLIADDVVWSRDGAAHFYSSHRITSHMTNLGASPLGPATGRHVRVRTIADCVVEAGVITREWLIRDNWSLLTQLGLDPHAVAAVRAATAVAEEYRHWLAAERARVRQSSDNHLQSVTRFSHAQATEFALANLRNAWIHGDDKLHAAQYAPYAVLHDSAPIASGCEAIRAHAAMLRRAFNDAALTVDHVCVVPRDPDTTDVAVRWTLDARHAGDLWGLPASGRHVTVLGITHWHLIANRIAAEWSIYDRLDILTQALRAPIKS